MEPHGRASLTGDRRHTDDVIDVRVREPDANRLRAALADLMQDEAGFFAGIDDHTLRLRRLLVDGEVGVLGERAGRDLHDLHAPTVPSALRSAVKYFSTAIAAVVASPTAVVICLVT